MDMQECTWTCRSAHGHAGVHMDMSTCTCARATCARSRPRGKKHVAGPRCHGGPAAHRGADERWLEVGGRLEALCALRDL